MRTALAFLRVVAAGLVACTGSPTAPAPMSPEDEWFAGTYELQAIENEAYPTENGILPVKGHLKGAACGGRPTSVYDGTCHVQVIAGTLRLTPRSATSGTARIATTYRESGEDVDTKVAASEHTYTVLGRSPDGTPRMIYLSLPSPGWTCVIGCGRIHVFLHVSETTAEVDYGYLWPETWRYTRR